MRWPVLPLMGVLLSCGTPVDPVDPIEVSWPEVSYEEPCDAGDEVWLRRTLQLLWGRPPHGAAEVGMWLDVVAEHGRDNTVRAMTYADDYYARWGDFLLDALAVARSGDRSHGGCWGSPLLEEHTGSLAAHIGAHGPAGEPYPELFNAADVLQDALVADDLSAVYRVNLFTRMVRPLQGANVGKYDLERNRRTNFGEAFLETYLGRNMTCLACHNSEYSITGHDDPALDRTWEIPGLYEKAIYGNSFGIAPDEAFAVFKVDDLVTEGTAAPWGIYTGHCGAFVPAGEVGDFMGHEAYFVEAFGESGSVWDVEALLAVGVDALEADGGVVLDEDGYVDGGPAFAYLVAAHLADEVWAEATGSALTIANYFPRNEQQRDLLQRFADVLAESRFSLRELLVVVTTDPYFNHGSPKTCPDAADHGLAPVFNAWSISDADPDRQGNGAGDVVHRRDARVLVRSVHDAMGWPQPNRFLATTDPLNDILLGIGAPMRESEPGFEGTDLQSLLAYEAAYGAGESPSAGGASNGCVATPSFAGCASCDCEADVCGDDPYCCEVQWDETCVRSCNREFGGCGGGLAEDNRDIIDRLLDTASVQDKDVGAVVHALKDRLAGDGAIDDEERALIEAMVGVPLSTPVNEAGDDLESGLRGLAGALLVAPNFYLALEPPPIGAVPSLSVSRVEDCDRVHDLLGQIGLTTSCGEG